MFREDQHVVGKHGWYMGWDHKYQLKETPKTIKSASCGAVLDDATAGKSSMMSRDELLGAIAYLQSFGTNTVSGSSAPKNQENLLYTETPSLPRMVALTNNAPTGQPMVSHTTTVGASPLSPTIESTDLVATGQDSTNLVPVALPKTPTDIDVDDIACSQVSQITDDSASTTTKVVRPDKVMEMMMKFFMEGSAMLCKDCGASSSDQTHQGGVMSSLGRVITCIYVQVCVRAYFNTYDYMYFDRLYVEQK